MEQQKRNSIHAQLLSIEVDQFAIFEENLSKDESSSEKNQLEMGITVGFGGSFQQKGISSSLRFELVRNDKPVVLITTNLFFTVTDQSFKKIYKKKTNSITIPRNVAVYIFSQTVGTARGILFEKASGIDKIKNMFIPILDPEEFVDDDVVIDFNAVTEEIVNQ